jgi:hypothetical protein
MNIRGSVVVTQDGHTVPEPGHPNGMLPELSEARCSGPTTEPSCDEGSACLGVILIVTRSAFC